ncbi:MAG TPA: hypothetical protein VLW49_03710 [Gaiellaceae bacterium]|nr:hypothetical protein [Gaiellaceae bacterium]
MKRVLLAAVALLLVLTGAAAARSLTHTTTAANKRLARAEARQLLGRFVLPDGAGRMRVAPHGDGGLLRQAASTPSGSLVDLHRLWRVHESLAATLAFVETHAPRGASRDGPTSAGGLDVPANEILTYTLQPLAGRISLRRLSLVLVSLPRGWTGVRADAQAVWVVARPAAEALPSDVQQVEIEVGYPNQPPKVSLHVQDAANVARIIAWLDALQVVQPGMFSCPMIMIGSATATFSFRAADGTLLAQARTRVEGTRATSCNPIALSIGGQAQKPLVGDFLGRVQQLLGVQLVLPPAIAAR